MRLRTAAGVMLGFLLVAVFLLLAAVIASAQPPAEGAWGYEVPAVVGMTGQPFEGAARVESHPSVDYAGIQTYSLHFGKDLGTVTLLADGDLPIAQLLRRASRVRVTVERMDDGRLERLGR